MGHFISLTEMFYRFCLLVVMLFKAFKNLTHTKEMYTDLYNSAGTKEEMVGIKNTIHEMINNESVEQCERVTGAVVKKACVRMKPGKSDVTGSYTRDIFLNAPDTVFSILAEIFKSYLVHGTCLLYTSPSPRDS